MYHAFAAKASKSARRQRRPPKWWWWWGLYVTSRIWATRDGSKANRVPATHVCHLSCGHSRYTHGPRSDRGRTRSRKFAFSWRGGERSGALALFRQRRGTRMAGATSHELRFSGPALFGRSNTLYRAFHITLMFVGLMLFVFGFALSFPNTTYGAGVLNVLNAPQHSAGNSCCSDANTCRSSLCRYFGAPSSPSLPEEEPRILVVNRDNRIVVSPVAELRLQPAKHQDGVDAAQTSYETCPTGSQSPHSVDSKIKLLIMVTSTCCTESARRKRNGIRQTWKRDGLSEHSDAVSIMFVLSTPTIKSEQDAEKVRAMLRKEIQENKASDLVLLNYATESYVNLPHKTIGLFRYMKYSSCGFSHVLKTDDDVYVRVPGVLSLIGYENSNWPFRSGYEKLQNIYESRPGAQFTRLFLSRVHMRGFQPNRDPKSKWYLTEEEWPDGVDNATHGRRWPTGWGYIVSRDMGEYVVNRMDFYESLSSRNTTAKNRNDLPIYYKGLLKIEDVMMGYLLSEVGVMPISGFANLWRGTMDECVKETVFKHLDVFSLSLMPVLSVIERSGMWRARKVECRPKESVQLVRNSVDYFSVQKQMENLVSIHTSYDLYQMPVTR